MSYCSVLIFDFRLQEIAAAEAKKFADEQEKFEALEREAKAMEELRGLPVASQKPLKGFDVIDEAVVEIGDDILELAAEEERQRTEVLLSLPLSFCPRGPSRGF